VWLTRYAVVQNRDLLPGKAQYKTCHTHQHGCHSGVCSALC
jgi:hypothetical protein